MTEFIQEGEIMLEEEEVDQMETGAEPQVKHEPHSASAAAEVSVAVSPPPQAITTAADTEERKEQNYKVTSQSIHQVEEWKNSTLVDLFESHSSSYDDALDAAAETTGAAGQTKHNKRPRRAVQTLERQYQNYQQIMNESINLNHHTTIASPASSRVTPATSRATPPTTFIRSQSHHLNAKQQQQHLPQDTTAAFASPTTPRGPHHRGPLATSSPAPASPFPVVIERTVASPTENRLMAERIKMMQAQRRQSGEKTGSASSAVSSSSSPPVTLSSNTLAAVNSAGAAAASTTAAPTLPPIPPSLPPYPASMFHPPPPPPQMPPHLLSSLPSAPFALGPGGPMPVPLGAAAAMSPPMFSHAEMMEEASLTNLLLSWYYAGYYTGKHQAMKAMRQEQQHSQQPSPPAPSNNGSAPSSSAAMEAAIQQYTASSTGTKRKFDSQ